MMQLRVMAHKSMRSTGMRDRLFKAWLRYQAKLGRPKAQEWLAEAVSKELGLNEPLTQGSVSRWLTGSEPNLRTIAALAKVLRVDPGWLAFGSDSAAPPPDDPMQEGMKQHPRET
jgi:transcriptional regulator with XRE-family HTH domain